MIAAASLVWGAPSWRTAAVSAAVVLLLLLMWNYWKLRAPIWVKLLAAGLKALGVAILALCLLEPLSSEARARPGANLFVVLADNSQSMTLRDRDAKQTRAEQVQSATTRPAAWLDRVRQDFDLRLHAFDTKLQAATADFGVLKFDGSSSNLAAALSRLQRQYHGRPLAGVLLMTDGNATDADAVERILDGKDGTRLPPIYPVLIGQEKSADDINLQRIDVTQTNFEDAPVTVAAQVTAAGYSGKTLLAQLVDESGKLIEQQTVKVDDERTPITVRFKLRPEQLGVSFYRVRVAEEKQVETLDHGGGTEATLANNTRLTTVDRGRGPYRVLYVAGRPNWEFKFLQRALQTDDQIQLVGLMRIAKREPKFAYLGRAGDSSNPLFKGFDNKDAEQAEQYDQPVLVRIGTRDADELRGGFPRTAEELNPFHAIIIDDLESEFFTQDQMLLLKEFVRQRGGGLLMLGGQESFHDGKYDRTAIGDVLPVYTGDAPSTAEGTRYRLSLTREGWLEPWIRLRPDATAEQTRLDTMPGFQTLNGVRGIKPGATVLASATVSSEAGGPGGATVPALVEQRFGKGRAAAMLIGDLWRWSMRRDPTAEDDLPKAWRQTVRWLVSDVPRQVEIAAAPRQDADDTQAAMNISVRVRDTAFAPQDNAAVALHVTTPDGQKVDLTAESSAREPGLYEAVYVPRQPGAYRVRAETKTADGTDIAAVDTGWTTDPAPDEFREIKPNRALLERIASKTGGQVVAAADLDGFARTLPTRNAEIVEPEIRPLWHQPWVFVLAIACFAAEWGLRR
ncbi:MAG TPA: glutamine amidotransferase, partial [Tepidisphaeraceae bacterium]